MSEQGEFMKSKKEKMENLEKTEQEELANQDKPLEAGLTEQENLEIREALPEGGEGEELTLEDQVEALQSALNETTAKAEEYLDGWQRSRAEFANYKKRILKENAEIRQVARGEVIKIYLDVLDDLERALREIPQENDGEAWVEGIDLIYQKLKRRLEAEGIRPMNPLGEEFDPNLHEALMKEESEDYESGRIIEVMQEGYWLGDKVLRPALVRVAA